MVRINLSMPNITRADVVKGAGSAVNGCAKLASAACLAAAGVIGASDTVEHLNVAQTLKDKSCGNIDLSNTSIKMVAIAGLVGASYVACRVGHRVSTAANNWAARQVQGVKED